FIAANAMTKHPGIVNFKSLWNRHIDHHFSELLIRLNSDRLLEKLTVICLKQGQLKVGSTKCILTNYNLLKKRKLKVKNLGVQVLQQAKSLGFMIEESDFTKGWNLNLYQLTN